MSGRGELHCGIAGAPVPHFNHGVSFAGVDARRESPLVFLHSVVNAVFHKTYHVKMGRWKSKSRHWWVGTANVNEGKPTGMRHFVNVVIQVLTENSSKAVGRAAVLRGLSYATRCLSTGGKTDPHQYIDLEHFLDAAHGDEVSHSTQKLREKVAKDVVPSPAAPSTNPLPLHTFMRWPNDS